MRQRILSKIISTAILASLLGLGFQRVADRIVKMGRDGYLAACTTRWTFFETHPHTIWFRLAQMMILLGFIIGLYEFLASVLFRFLTLNRSQNT
jgi:membrane protein required for beta-lactamase induction